MNTNNKNNTNNNHARLVRSFSQEKMPFEYMINFDRLYLSYENCNLRKATKTSAMQFSYATLCDNLQNIVDDINERTYIHSRSSCFTVSYPCAREIYAAQYRDRIVQHFVCEEIERALDEELVDRTASCRIGKGTDYALSVLRDDVVRISNGGSTNCFFYKMDLHGYFMSINRRLMADKMLDLIERRYDGEYKEELRYLVPIIYLNNPSINRVLKCSEAQLMQVPERKRLKPDGDCGMAIGNITSQHGSNLYLSYFDHYVMDELGFKGYIRYVDDIIILSDRREYLKEIRPLIVDKLSESGVFLNPHKSFIDTAYHGIKFLGRETYPYGYQKQAKSSAARLMLAASTMPIDEKILSRLNSQVGRLKHYSCYFLLQDFLKALPRGVWDYVWFDESAYKFRLNIDGGIYYENAYA